MHTAGRARSAGEVKGSINEVARHDFTIMKELFDFDLSVLGSYFFRGLHGRAAALWGDR